MKHVRESIFREHGHYSGKWAEWLREVDFDITTAKRFMKVFDEFGNSSDTWHHLSMRVLYEIATLPKEAREQVHTIPSTGESKTVDEMTVRELREVKKALKEAQQNKQQIEQDNIRLAQLLTEERNRQPQVIERDNIANTNLNHSQTKGKLVFPFVNTDSIHLLY